MMMEHDIFIISNQEKNNVLGGREVAAFKAFAAETFFLLVLLGLFLYQLI
jgi:hypothetical protein